MKVRDHTMSIKEYKGRETDASDAECPCRPCFNAHDCGYYVHAGWWVVKMECATRHNFGCGDKPQAEHSFNKKGICKRCKVHKTHTKQDEALLQSLTLPGGEDD